VSGSTLDDLLPLARDVIAGCQKKRLKVATAESCTGGLVIATLTEVPGSSAVVDRGLVTYSNEAKVQLLGVPAELIAARGSVSEEVARAMAEGILANSLADLGVGITGVAGPGGGSADKPVGLVHFAAVRRGEAPRHAVHVFENLGRSSIRLASVRVALTMLRELI